MEIAVIEPSPDPMNQGKLSNHDNIFSGQPIIKLTEPSRSLALQW